MTNMTTSLTEKLDYIWGTYNVPDKYVNARFDNYFPSCIEQEAARKTCFNYARNSKDIFHRGKGLFLQGPVGTGKTHLAVATLRAIVENHIDSFGCMSSDLPIYGQKEYSGYTCSMISTVELLNIVRLSYSGKKQQANHLLRRARICEVIILDDIGAEKSSDWVEELLYSLIDLRYRMQRATILTSNCDLTELEASLGERIISRIFEICSGVKLDGEDYRKKI